MDKFEDMRDSSCESRSTMVVPFGFLTERDHLKNLQQLRSSKIMNFVNKFVQVDSGSGNSGAMGSSHKLPKTTVDAPPSFRKTPFSKVCKTPDEDDSDDSDEEENPAKEHVENNSSGIESDENNYSSDLESLVNCGKIIQGRYEVDVHLGEGSYGFVVRAFDHQEQTQVAIKISKKSAWFIRQAKEELKILEFLNNADYKDEYHLVRLKGHFMWLGRLCIVFELLSMNLYEHIKDNGAMPCRAIRKFAHQICEALMFLSKPEINIIHCDLKPENILLCDSGVKIADFGTSQKIGGEMELYIQSRFYRAPEVILGLPYDSAIDMWSFGCVAVELFTGEPLFPGQDVNDQMNKIVEVLGIPPQHLLDQANDTKSFFHKIMPSEQYALNPTNKHYSLPGSRDWYSIMPMDSENACDIHLYVDFINLISRILVYDPKDRISPKDALNHRFFNSCGWNYWKRRPKDH